MLISMCVCVCVCPYLLVFVETVSVHGCDNVCILVY